MNPQMKMSLRRWQRKPYVTYGLMVITIVMFFLQTVNGGSENPLVLVQYGAKVNQLIIFGEWWRLITPVFLHIGFEHILFNCVLIYFLGIQVEDIFGHWRYFLLYMLSALAGNVTSFAFNQSISAGASTALFGLFGATLALPKLFPNNYSIKEMSKRFMALIIINLVFGIFSSGIDMAGHIGGIAGGYLLTYALSAPNAWVSGLKVQGKYAAIYLIALIILLVIGWQTTSSLYF
ncbi:rhomboid family intramembrane serine protease [Marinilactibacillus sp. Marseille-P9653]|uniref:rhomboid family intramembrane serine protease n=1 Tax=Marinilactibacillus sp. Marseille-P9653 TaxID=2866583 RepID=UPI001CE43590|nr:rhomboid family intramembrane serine protease [Marinilactibacillus sp. Marseille-P9653]